MVRILIGLMLVELVSLKPVLAYIDPGTGSMLLQACAAAFFAMLFTIKSWWGIVRQFFSRSAPSSSADNDEAAKKSNDE